MAQTNEEKAATKAADEKAATDTAAAAGGGSGLTAEEADAKRIDASTLASGTQVGNEPAAPAPERTSNPDAKVEGDKSAEMQQSSVDAMRASGGAPRETASTTHAPVVIKAGEAGEAIPTEAFGTTEQLVTVGADVWAEVWPENALRPSHILLFHKGQRVPETQLKAAVDERRGVQHPVTEVR